ncbi:MAG TPA: NERD domain-containing protein [Lachnospiraceae bacterium]|nr:NERD domain-containing protein [Lachnospiraceae bacterium]
MFLLLSILLFFGIYYVKNIQFKQGSYYKITHNSFLSTIFDIGRNGEYQIYKRLCYHENTGGKFLFNCYLPKENGETTEIDVLLINSNGIFVFESKNYSGWIFGDEKEKNWTQTLPQGKGHSHKERFFNPIMQNKIHIKWLRNMVGDAVTLYSIIVFSERCTLKKVNVTSQDVQVINRHVIERAVNQAGSMQSSNVSLEEIKKIYDKLYPFTQISEEQKLQHVHNINKNNSPHQLNNEKVRFINLNGKNDSGHICPKCGAQLVLRTAKKGINAGKQFYGCSNYPKCRYIR